MTNAATAQQAPLVFRSRYFADMHHREKNWPPLPPLARPCGDCAVTSCLYVDIAERLADEAPAAREVILANWNCHNARHNGCAGAREHVARVDDHRASLLGVLAARLR